MLFPAAGLLYQAVATRWHTYQAYCTSVAFFTVKLSAWFQAALGSLTGQERGAYESRGLQDEDGLHERPALLFHTQRNQHRRPTRHHRHATQFQRAHLTLHLQTHHHKRPLHITLAASELNCSLKITDETRMNISIWCITPVKVHYSDSKWVSGQFWQVLKIILNENN